MIASYEGFSALLHHFDNPSVSLSLSIAPLPAGVEGQDKRLETVALRHPVTRVLPFR